MTDLLAGIALGLLFAEFIDLQGRKNFHKIVWARKPYKATLWERVTATCWLTTCGYEWKESWTRMKYSPNYI